jgi:hypothetical protein
VYNGYDHEYTRVLSAMKMLPLYTVMIILFFGLTGFFGEPRFDEKRAKYMEQNVAQIKVGMTKQELKSMLGRPDYYEPKKAFFYNDGGLEKASSWSYLYPDDDFSYQIDFNPKTGKVIKAEKLSTPIWFP